MESQVIVVTGAASGMGKAAATRWARQGAKLAAVDRSGDVLKQLEAEIPNLRAFECDVTDEEAVRRVAAEIRSGLGEIDRLVNAAGICISGSIGDLEPAAFRKTMEVNYFGTVHWVHAVIGPMRARRRGQIVLFSSMGGYFPGPGVDAYIASKFAVLGYAEVLHQKVSPEGIRVVCICPPPVDTPLLSNFMEGSKMHPAAAKFMRPMTPDQIVDSIEKALPGKKFLLLPDATAKGAYIGRRLAPNLLSKLVGKYAG
ncbi:MAG TPA: SDR family NAD(P)-dependent oxidoreductase [Acidimicrobiia bacterium]|nr:SDR family NAD(P)-dependent oxidoreductase [Acidimicrobiia bacterium]